MLAKETNSEMSSLHFAVIFFFAISVTAIWFAEIFNYDWDLSTYLISEYLKNNLEDFMPFGT